MCDSLNFPSLVSPIKRGDKRVNRKSYKDRKLEKTECHPELVYAYLRVGEKSINS